MQDAPATSDRLRVVVTADAKSVVRTGIEARARLKDEVGWQGERVWPAPLDIDLDCERQQHQPGTVSGGHHAGSQVCAADYVARYGLI